MKKSLATSWTFEPLTVTFWSGVAPAVPTISEPTVWLLSTTTASPPEMTQPLSLPRGTRWLPPDATVQLLATDQLPPAGPVQLMVHVGAPAGRPRRARHAGGGPAGGRRAGE